MRVASGTAAGAGYRGLTIAIARLVEILPPLGAPEEDVRKRQVREAAQHGAARSGVRPLLR